MLNEELLSKSIKRVINEYIDNDKGMLFEMANISSSRTGLPFVVWVQTCMPGNHGNHNAPRVKFQIQGSLYPMSIEAQPRLLTKIKREQLPINAKDYRAMINWIVKNQIPLLKLWSGEITTDEFLDQIQKI